MALARIIKPPRNPFVFPATNPGFDQSHIASVNPLLSGVARNGNIISLLSSALGTSNGAGNAPAASMGGMIGPSIYVPNNGSISFPYANTAWSAQTMAAIVIFDAQTSANIRNIMSTSAAGNAGFLLGMTTTGASAQAWSYLVGATFTNIATGFPSSALIGGVPYFFAVSIQNGQAANSVLCRLDTGQMGATSTANAASFTAGDTTIHIGNRGANTRQTIGRIAAVMHANNYLSQPQLLQWAADPWAFWYPRR
jgi:hypothetical protein